MKAGFNKRDGASVIVAFLTLVPFLATIFLGFGRQFPLIVVVVAGVGMIASGYALAWGTESLQFVVSQVLALAFLATLQVLPEYATDVVLSYNGAFDPTQLHFATASMTGANRLLLGIGWPAVFFLSYFSSRAKKRDSPMYLQLERTQTLEILFLGVSTLYSFVIIAKGTLDLLDAGVLFGIFGLYLYVATRIPPIEKRRMEEMEGVALAVGRTQGWRKYLMVLSFLAMGAFMTSFGAQPFVGSLLEIGASLRVDQYLLIQWVAPFLTEFPETITAFYWAAKSSHAPIAIGNLVSSKLNQWTLLVGTIPVVYNVALNAFRSIILTQLQLHELLLTASQSLYGVVCLLDLRLSMRESVLLLGMFLLQFFLPPVRLEVSVAYILLAVLELLGTYKNAVIFHEAREFLLEYLH